MAQFPEARAAYLNTYFRDTHGFQPERDLGGVIVYRRTIVGQEVERIVVKHAEVDYDQDKDIVSEEGVLLKLWGSEHIIQLLSVARGQRHRGHKWREPKNRASQNPLPILPWKLHIDQRIYGNNLDFPFIVMEYLPRGSGVHSAQYQNIFSVADLIQQIARLQIDSPGARDVFLVDDIIDYDHFESYLDENFYRYSGYSFELRALLAICLAENPVDRLLIEPVLQRCEAQVRRIVDLAPLRAEVSRIFDEVPVNNNGNNGSEDGNRLLYAS
ncbi:hypothetical protein F5Y03DRAFT_406636 [Xylaria venustula]|nr:hypothetical protein F5Y03DRAFT_406636 [Xylaria venustula]